MTMPVRVGSTVLALLSGLALGTAPGGAAHAADMTAHDLTQMVFEAPEGARPDLSRLDLRFLDLSGLDFRRALLEGSDLYGVDLATADLSRTTLVGARLDRATIIGANFSNADLTKATIRRPTAASSLAYDPADAPRFTGAKLAGCRIMARLNGADMRGADLSDADLGPDEPRGSITIQPHTELGQSDLSGAVLRRAILVAVSFRFAKLRGADLTGADLRFADFSKADLSGADLTGADLAHADLDQAILTGVKGLTETLHLDQAQNMDRAVR
jgi:uncharacterized protein YjbI with pentapeptide repeats